MTDIPTFLRPWPTPEEVADADSSPMFNLESLPLPIVYSDFWHPARKVDDDVRPDHVVIDE